MRMRSPLTLLKHTLLNFVQLRPERRGKLLISQLLLFRILCVLTGHLASASVLQSSELFMYVLILLAVPPDFAPVDVRVTSRRGTNNFQHPLGWVRFGWALVSTVRLEVFGDLVAVFADLTKSIQSFRRLQGTAVCRNAGTAWRKAGGWYKEWLDPSSSISPVNQE